MKLATLAFGMVLALGLLSACGGQQASSGSGSAADTPAASTVDASSWKTLGDALAAKTDDVSSGWDDKYYIVAFKSGDSLFRVVAKSEEGIQDKTSELDFLADDYNDKLLEVIGGLEIVSVEDLTAEVPTQEQLDAMVGKTGQELIDDGWAFQSYFMTGGDETGATFTKGMIACNVTFGAKVSTEAADSDEIGDLLKDAKVILAESAGVSEDATDPTKVG
jgi:hypothetical protein